MATPASTRLSAPEARRFGITVGGAFLLLAALLVWRDHPSRAMIAGALGVLLVGAGLVVPGRLGPVHRIWMRLAMSISRVTTPILMAVIYFVLVMPIGLLRRAMGRDSIARDRRARSYWSDREPPGRSDMLRQF